MPPATSLTHSHIDDPALVGQRIRQAREHAGLSQRDLATDGCTAAYISRLEAGARVPSTNVLQHLATKLNVTVDHLAHGITGGISASIHGDTLAYFADSHGIDLNSLTTDERQRLRIAVIHGAVTAANVTMAAIAAGRRS